MARKVDEEIGCGIRKLASCDFPEDVDVVYGNEVLDRKSVRILAVA